MSGYYMAKHKARQRHTKSSVNKADVLDCLVPPNIESGIILACVTTAQTFYTAMATVSKTLRRLAIQDCVIAFEAC